MLELNNLPIPPEHYESELVDQLMAERPELLSASLMIKKERYFLNGLVRLYKPKKVLEIGVFRGGSTCILLNALHDMPEATVTSIDIMDSFAHNGVRYNVGEAVPPSTEKSRWKLVAGKDPVEVIEEIDGPFDFLVLDTAHIHPIESLNFLAAFPFMTEDAVVVLHDINLFLYSHVQEFPRALFACKLLFDTITARKLEPDQQWFTRANIGAFQLLPYTKDHIEDVFSMLSFPWGLSTKQKEYDTFFRKYYSVKAHNYFRMAALIYDYMQWDNTGYNVRQLDVERLDNIRVNFEKILKKKRFIFYGAGEAAVKFIRYFKKNNLRLPDEIWDIGAINKTGFEIPVTLPRFDTLNNDECGMIITITDGEIIREIYKRCEDTGFDRRINICFLLILGKQSNESNAEGLSNICKDIEISLLDVVYANVIDEG